MAKKSPKSPRSKADPNKSIHSRVSAQELRWGDIEIDKTEDQHLKSELYLAQIRRLLDHIKSMNLTWLHMDGYTHFTKASDFLKKFASNLQEAVNEAQLQATLKARKTGE